VRSPGWPAARPGRRLPRLVRLVAASTIATLIDATVLVLCAHRMGLAAGLAGALGAGAGGVVNFAINRIWVFDAGRGPVLAQAAAYAAIVVGGGALLTAAIVGAAVAGGAPLLVAKGGAVAAVMLLWTYPVSARMVFARGAVTRCRSGGSA
jgi:putative flippase GtrA